MERRLLTVARDQRWGVAAAIAGTALLTSALAAFQSRIGLLNEGLGFLLLTVLIAATWGWLIRLFAALLTNLTLNFIFIPPLHTFAEIGSDDRLAVAGREEVHHHRFQGAGAARSGGVIV